MVNFSCNICDHFHVAVHVIQLNYDCWTYDQNHLQTLLLEPARHDCVILALCCRSINWGLVGMAELQERVR